MFCQVRLSANAARNLEEIYAYIHQHGSPKQADYVLDQIEKAFQSLSEHPIVETILGICSMSKIGNVGKYSSSPIASSTK